MADKTKEPDYELLWNALSGDQRLAFLEHAEMVVTRGYMPNPDNKDYLEIAKDIFIAQEKAAPRKRLNSS